MVAAKAEVVRVLEGSAAAGSAAALVDAHRCPDRGRAPADAAHLVQRESPALDTALASGELRLVGSRKPQQRRAALLAALGAAEARPAALTHAAQVARQNVVRRDAVAPRVRRLRSVGGGGGGAVRGRATYETALLLDRTPTGSIRGDAVLPALRRLSEFLHISTLCAPLSRERVEPIPRGGIVLQVRVRVDPEDGRQPEGVQVPVDRLDKYDGRPP